MQTDYGRFQKKYLSEICPKTKQRQGFCPVLVIPYYTIPKLIRELKRNAVIPLFSLYYTIPKLIRELKLFQSAQSENLDYTIPKLIRELKLRAYALIWNEYYTIPKLIRELKHYSLFAVVGIIRCGHGSNRRAF